MIIVSGDSWSLGEWAEGSTHILHGGISQYLSDHGFTVTNLGQSGSSNRESLLRVTNFLRNNPHLKKVQKTILIFQTEWTRDFPYLIDEDECFLHDTICMRDRLVSRFYYDLSSLAQEFDVEIKILGGSGDTLFIDDFSTIYTGEEIWCQSITNLLVENNSRIDDPICSTYSVKSLPLIETIKKHINDDVQMDQLISELEKGQKRVDTFLKNPKFFYPDGSHPNRIAHRILFDHIIERL
jgi:hypothetical protein